MRPPGPVRGDVAQVDAELPGAAAHRRRRDRRARPASHGASARRCAAAAGAAARRRASTSAPTRLRSRACGATLARPPAQARRVAGVALDAVARAASATSMRISSEPTASVCPTSPPSASTLPATGDGISTRRLVGHHVGEHLVLDHRVARLDVPGDELDLGDAFADVGHLDDVDGHASASLHRAPHRRADALRPREVRPLERVRIRRVPAGDALDRRLEVIEAVLLHQRRPARRRSRWCASPRGRRRSGRSSSPSRRSSRRSSGQRVRRSMISASMPVSLRRRLGDEDHRAVGQHRQRRCRGGTPPPSRAAPCSGPRAPRPADASTTARSAGRGGRRTGRCRAAWARGR